MNPTSFKSLDDVLAAIPSALNGERRNELAGAVAHCAQSIELSVRGYPRHKSRLFQRTAGRLAFLWFSRKGAMSHDLTAAIPGAEPVAADSPEAALERLSAAVALFRSAEALQPHFAFGPLTRAEYERAHVMHIADHLAALG